MASCVAAMMEVLDVTTRRSLRRRRNLLTLFIALVTASSVVAVLILVVIRLYRLLVRWKLLRLAGDRRLLTFRSTPNWGIGNAMFAFASTLAISRTDRGHSPALLCFDAHLQLRAAFPLLADWPACSPTDVLQLLDPEWRHEHAYAR